MTRRKRSPAGGGAVDGDGSLDETLGPVCDFARQAYGRVRNALRSGKLRREACVLCGSKENLEAHHMSRRALDVVWLCCSCHHMVSRLGIGNPKWLEVHIRLQRARIGGTSVRVWCAAGGGWAKVVKENICWRAGGTRPGAAVWTLVKCKTSGTYVMVRADGAVRRVSNEWAVKQDAELQGPHCDLEC